MDNAAVHVNADVPLHAEVPLVPFLCLVHLGVSLLVPVLRGGGCCNDRGIDDRPVFHEQSVPLKEVIDDLEHLLLETMLFEQMPEVEDGGFIGDSVTEQINVEELLEGVSVVDVVLCFRIGEVVPLLQEVDLEHEFEFLPLSPRLLLFIVRFDLPNERFPGNDAVHLVEEAFAAEFLVVGDGEK